MRRPTLCWWSSGLHSRFGNAPMCCENNRNIEVGAYMEKLRFLYGDESFTLYSLQKNFLLSDVLVFFMNCTQVDLQMNYPLLVTRVACSNCIRRSLKFRTYSQTQRVRVRFAPSPTGWAWFFAPIISSETWHFPGFLHIGGLRTALINFLFAKSRGMPTSVQSGIGVSNTRIRIKCLGKCQSAISPSLFYAWLLNIPLLIIWNLIWFRRESIFYRWWICSQSGRYWSEQSSSRSHKPSCGAISVGWHNPRWGSHAWRFWSLRSKWKVALVWEVRCWGLY